MQSLDERQLQDARADRRRLDVDQVDRACAPVWMRNPNFLPAVPKTCFQSKPLRFHFVTFQQARTPGLVVSVATVIVGTKVRHGAGPTECTDLRNDRAICFDFNGLWSSM